MKLSEKAQRLCFALLIVKCNFENSAAVLTPFRPFTVSRSELFQNFKMLSDKLNKIYIISSKKFGQTKIIKKSKLPFSDNFCMQKLNFQTESMSQCHLKIQLCMQKLLKIGRLLFLIISVCPNFLQLSIFFS